MCEQVPAAASAVPSSGLNITDQRWWQAPPTRIGNRGIRRRHLWKPLTRFDPSTSQTSVQPDPIAHPDRLSSLPTDSTPFPDADMNFIPGPRPHRLIGVLGTATEVGKTWVSARLLQTWCEQGIRVAARKPVQSFAPDDITTDAALLAAATGEDEFDVCPAHRRYEVPMAPPMAAEVLGRPAFTLVDLIQEIHWPTDTEIGLVETVGGPRSPLATDGDSVLLLQALQVDEIVLVADAELGTINAVRLAIDCLPEYRYRVLLNRFDKDNDLHRHNLQWLVGSDQFPVYTDLKELAHALKR